MSIKTILFWNITPFSDESIINTIRFVMMGIKLYRENKVYDGILNKIKFSEILQENFKDNVLKLDLPNNYCFQSNDPSILQKWSKKEYYTIFKFRVLLYVSIFNIWNTYQY